MSALRFGCKLLSETRALRPPCRPRLGSRCFRNELFNDGFSVFGGLLECTERKPLACRRVQCVLIKARTASAGIKLTRKCQGSGKRAPGAAHMDKAGLHIGAIAFIHRFGSSLNEHVHFHVCVVDGVFEEVEGEGDADATPRISSPGVIFHAATGIDAATVAPVQTTLQKRILRAFVARGLLENCDAKDMLGYKHSGFSVDAGVCIEAHDRAALERLLRYCARPPFSMERLRKEGSKLVYRCAGVDLFSLSKVTVGDRALA